MTRSGMCICWNAPTATLYCGVTSDLDRRLAQHNGLEARRRPIYQGPPTGAPGGKPGLRAKGNGSVPGMCGKSPAPEPKTIFPAKRRRPIVLSAEVILIFFATSLLLGVAPGPDNIFVLTQSAMYGVTAAL